MKICSFYTLLHGTGISPGLKQYNSNKPPHEWLGAYSNGGLISKFRSTRGLFEYGGLNEDLRYIFLIQ